MVQMAGFIAALLHLVASGVSVNAIGDYTGCPSMSQADVEFHIGRDDIFGNKGIYYELSVPQDSTDSAFASAEFNCPGLQWKRYRCSRFDLRNSYTIVIKLTYFDCRRPLLFLGSDDNQAASSQISVLQLANGTAEVRFCNQELRVKTHVQSTIGDTINLAVVYNAKQRRLSISTPFEEVGLECDDHVIETMAVSYHLTTANFPSMKYLLIQIFSRELDGRELVVRLKKSSNIAMTGVASQSSTYASSSPTMFQAQNAIDGFRTVSLIRGSCSSTKFETEAWWQVDFTSAHTIVGVKLVTSFEGSPVSGANVTVGFGNSRMSCGGTQQQLHGDAIHIDCGTPIVGDRVRVSPWYLGGSFSACEIDVEGGDANLCSYTCTAGVDCLLRSESLLFDCQAKNGRYLAGNCTHARILDTLFHPSLYEAFDDGPPSDIGLTPRPHITDFIDAPGNRGYCLKTRMFGKVILPCTGSSCFTSLSVSFWLHLHSAKQDVLQGFLKIFSLEVNYHTNYDHNTRLHSLVFVLSSTDWTASCEVPAGLSIWVHLAMVVRSGRLHCFTNGKETTSGGRLSVHNVATTIGPSLKMDAEVIVENQNGDLCLDEFAVFNRSLSDDEVTDMYRLYTEGTSGLTNSAVEIGVSTKLYKSSTDTLTSLNSGMNIPNVGRFIVDELTRLFPNHSTLVGIKLLSFRWGDGLDDAVLQVQSSMLYSHITLREQELISVALPRTIYFATRRGAMFLNGRNIEGITSKPLLYNVTGHATSLDIQLIHSAGRMSCFGGDDNHTTLQLGLRVRFTSVSFVAPNITDTRTIEMFECLNRIRITHLKPFSNVIVFVVELFTRGVGSSVALQANTSEAAPGEAPVILPESSSTNTSLRITFNGISPEFQNGILLGYQVTYKRQQRASSTDESTSEDIQSEVLSKMSTWFLLRNLKPDTVYVITIAGFTRIGNGPEARLERKTSRVIGTVTEWSNWTNCSLPCETGTQTRNRNCLNPFFANEAAFCDEIVIDTRICNTHKCVVTGNWSAWENWSVCTTLCNSGWRNRTRRCERNPLVKSEIICVGNDTELGRCDEQECLGPASWTPWDSWSVCSTSCGLGLKQRSRLCENATSYETNETCDGDSEELKRCDIPKCPGVILGEPGRDCNSTCSNEGLMCWPWRTNGIGRRVFSLLGIECADDNSRAQWSQPYHPSVFVPRRRCEGYRRMPSVISCEDENESMDNTSRICNCMDKGSVGYTAWSLWSFCSRSCGGGIRLRSRLCMNGPCTGQKSESEHCATNICPVNGQWGQWSNWRTCSVSCGGGIRKRTRPCDNPSPAFGGRFCVGNISMDEESCSQNICPVFGNWSEWTSWSYCSKPCGGGTSLGERSCISPIPDYTGNVICYGEAKRAEICNPTDCAADVWYELSLRYDSMEFRPQFSDLQSPESIQLLTSIEDEIGMVFGSSNPIAEMSLTDIESGSVVVKLKLRFTILSPDDVIMLQDYLEVNGRLGNESTSILGLGASENPLQPARPVSVTPLDSRKVLVSWEPPSTPNPPINVTFLLFYRPYVSEVGNWQSVGAPWFDSAVVVTGLRASTVYRFRFMTATVNSSSHAGPEFYVTTTEGVPDIAPLNLNLSSVGPHIIYVEWSEIPVEHVRGLLFGYRIRYKKFNDDTFNETTVTASTLDAIITRLEPDTTYAVNVAGYTIMGNGVFAEEVVQTSEAAPSRSPAISGINLATSDTEVKLTWGEMSNGERNGHLQGYKISYREIQESGLDIIYPKTWQEIMVDAYTHETTLNGLESYALYDVRIAAFNEIGDGPQTPPAFRDTCKCPLNIFVNWHHSTTFIYKSEIGYTGLMADFLNSALISACGLCNNASSVLHFERSPNGDRPEKVNEAGVLEAISSSDSYGVSLPVTLDMNVDVFDETSRYLPLAKSVGSVYIVRDPRLERDGLRSVFGALINVWPVYVFTFLAATVVAILMWAFEQFSNPKQFPPGQLFRSIGLGLWWSFISMTTVGYGDVYPRTRAGRTLAMCWIFCGMMIVAVVTATMTSTLTMISLEEPYQLYGTKVAVLEKSLEKLFAIRRNSILTTGHSMHDNFEDLLAAVEDKHVDVALVDALLASANKESINRRQLVIYKLVDFNSGYGIVLSGKLVKLYDDLKSFVASHQQIISKVLETSSKDLQVDVGLSRIKTSVEAGSSSFKMAVAVLSVMLVVAAISGYMVWRWRLRFPTPSHITKQVATVKQAEALLADVNSLRRRIDKRWQQLSTKHALELIAMQHKLSGTTHAHHPCRACCCYPSHSIELQVKQERNSARLVQYKDEHYTFTQLTQNYPRPIE